MAVKRLTALAVAATLLPAAAQANEPLYARNLSPVSGLFGLPSQRFAGTADAGVLDLNLHSSIASHYVAEINGNEQVNLDGETIRVALELRYAIAENWDIQLEVPWLDHSGGFLDSAIDSWHDFWGMSDGGRSDVERDLLDYRYTGPGANFALYDDASGIGDTTLSVTWQFVRDELFAASVSAGYKFGTGDAEDFTGSGEDDVYVVARFSGDHLNDHLPLRWHGQVGYLYAGETDLLGDAQEQDLWFAGLALDWVINDRWSIIGQIDAHAAPMSSDVTALGDEAIMLTAGARWRFANDWGIDFSIVEDIQVETAPDVIFQASLRYSPR